MISEHLHLALAIQRRHKPTEWGAALEALAGAGHPPAAVEECRLYLRGMYARARVVADLKGEKGWTSKR